MITLKKLIAQYYSKKNQLRNVKKVWSVAQYYSKKNSIVQYVKKNSVAQYDQLCNLKNNHI
jgi:ribosomal protein S15P/S13E